MPTQVNTISLDAPSSDPQIDLSGTFTLDIGATQKGGGANETATFYPQFSTDDVSFSNITGATDITASPVSRAWTGEGTYSFTITGDTGGTYYVRGYCVASRELAPGEPETVELYTSSQMITVNADRVVEPGVASLSLTELRPSKVNPEGSFGGYGYSSNPPDGVVSGTIGQFVLVSLLSDEFTVQWCAIGNPASWPTPNTDAARAVQAGSEALNPRYGKITGIVGNPFFGYVFQEQGITRFVYVGGDVVFRIEPFETSRGCIGYNRFRQVDDSVFFESQIGYHMVAGTEVQDIGLGVVDDTYKPTLTTEQSNVVANPDIDSVFFDQHNLCFNYKTGQWTRQPAYSDDKYYPLNSSAGSIGRIVYSGTAVELQTGDSGDKQTAVIQTGDADLNQGARGVVTGVRPIVNGGTSYVRVGHRDSLTPTDRVNLITQSEILSEPTDNLVQALVTTNAIASPAGPVTADKLIEGTSDTFHYIAKDYASELTSPGETLTLSVYAKAAERRWLLLYAPSVNSRYFNLSTGAAGGYNVFNDGDYGIDSIGDGWYRCWINFVSGGANDARIYVAQGDEDGSYTGNGTSGLYVWGAQLESASSPTAYISTNGGARTENTMFSLPRGVNSRTGLANVRQEGRYHRIEVSVTDDWKTIIGADIDFDPQGRI